MALGVAAMAAACLAFSSCTHEHRWGEWLVVQEGTCTTRAIENRVCLDDRSHVEERSTFFHHEYGENDVCTLCGGERVSDGLALELAKDGTYRVAGIGECRDAIVYIPREYDGVAVTAVKNGAFMGNLFLQSINIPDSVVRIGDSAFSGCAYLENVSFGENVAEIGTSAFNGCLSLQSVSLPEGLQTLGRRAFFECSSLLNAYLGGCQDVSDKAFMKCGKLQSVSFGKDVCSIGVEAFADCSELLSVPFGEQLQTIGESAFRKCGKLTKIVFPQTIVKIGGYAFRECVSLKEVQIPASLKNIPLAAFMDCAALESVTIAEGVESVGGDAFRGCEKLTFLHLPTSIKLLGERAFSECIGLQSMIIGDVQLLTADVFEKCQALETVFFHGTKEEWDSNLLSSMSTLETVVSFYYSEEEPMAEEECWRFVDGVPTLW